MVDHNWQFDTVVHTQRPNLVEQQALLFQAHQIVCSAGVLSKISKFQVQLFHLGANIAWHVCIQRANCTIRRFFVQHLFSVTHLSIRQVPLYCELFAFGRNCHQVFSENRGKQIRMSGSDFELRSWFQVWSGVMQSAVPVPVGSRLQEIAKIQNYIAPAWLNRPACILGTSIYPSKEEVWAQQPFGLCPLGCVVANITTQRA